MSFASQIGLLATRIGQEMKTKATTASVTAEASTARAAEASAALKANNLSDLTNSPAARTNLGLGTAATAASSAFDAAGAAATVQTTLTAEATTARAAEDIINALIWMTA